MRSSSALWFHIETAFTEIRALCVQTRAAQLTQPKQKAQPRAMKRTMVSLGANDDDEPSTDDPRLAGAAELARDLAFREENAGGPDLVALRDQIRKRLKRLESRLAEVLGDYDRYHALFPIVVYIDEFVQISTRGEIGRWEPLQGELFDEDNGGETFFNILEEKIRQTETHPLVLEIFYFCLSDGFTGVYQGDPKRLEEFKERLAERISLKPIETARAEGPRGVNLVSFPWIFYAAAVLLVVVTHLILSWVVPSV